MVVSEKVKEKVKEEILKAVPLIDVDAVKKEVLEFLTQVKFPGYPDADSWDEAVKTFPATVEEQEMLDGRRLRLAFRLFTKTNQYLISIIESLHIQGRGVYIMCVHVNWQTTEKRIQKNLEETYTGEFKDTLRTKHTIWAETFRSEELKNALTDCFIAILGYELVSVTDSQANKRPIKNILPVSLEIPEKILDD
jgi:hypothetical protein